MPLRSYVSLGHCNRVRDGFYVSTGCYWWKRKEKQVQPGARGLRQRQVTHLAKFRVEGTIADVDDEFVSTALDVVTHDVGSLAAQLYA